MVCYGKMDVLEAGPSEKELWVAGGYWLNFHFEWI